MASSAACILDRIDTTVGHTDGNTIQLNERFHATSTTSMVDALFGEQLLGAVAVVSSFGAESAVLLHLIAAVNPAVPVLFLDTGKHFAETLAYRDLLIAQLGLEDVRNLMPDPAALAAKDETGLRWSYDPDGCCAIRKVAPLEAALAPFDAEFSGRKAFQSTTRTALPRFEIANGRLKVNPLADWDKPRIDAYMTAHHLPAHPLIAQGYLSIGCAPCTSIVQPGDDPRSGRWRGWDKVECGIHKPITGASEMVPPGYDPIF